MVDYGQDSPENKERNKLKMHDTKGGVLEFNSVVAILNYLHVNGWELAAMKDTEDFESYIMRKRGNFSSSNTQQASSSIGND